MIAILIDTRLFNVSIGYRVLRLRKRNRKIQIFSTLLCDCVNTKNNEFYCVYCDGDDAFSVVLDNTAPSNSKVTFPVSSEV